MTINREGLIILTVGLIALVLVTGRQLNYTLGWGIGFPMMGSWMMGGWGWSGFTVLFFGVLIIVGTYFLLQGFGAPRRDDSNRALNLAKERYARGEITLKEFEEIKQHLS